MKVRRIRDITEWTESDADAVEWDGSQKAYETIVKMCSKDYEITVKNDFLCISNHLHMFECCIDIGGFVIVNHGELLVIPRIIFESQYVVIEEKAE